MRAGLQCKPLRVESLTYCCFGQLAHCPHSFLQNNFIPRNADVTEISDVKYAS